MARRIRAWWKSETRENLTNNALVLALAGATTGLALAGSAAWVMLRR